MNPEGQDPSPKEILSVIDFLKKQVAGERCNSIQVLSLLWSHKLLTFLASLELNFALIVYQY